MNQVISYIENRLNEIFGNIKLFEKIFLGMEGSYVELLTILALGLLAIIPVIAPLRRRQAWRRVNQLLGVAIFIFVVYTCLGVFGMVRNFFRGLSEIGRENIIALYYCSVPATILVTSLLFGPAFCGWICPTGALQEFVGLISQKWTRKWKKEGYPFSKITLTAAIIVAAVFFVWMARLSVTRLFFIEDSNIYWSEVVVITLFILAFRMKKWDGDLRRLKVISFWIVVIGSAMSIRITSPVHFGFAKVYDPASFLSTVIIILAALAVPNIWCRYLCPWRCVIGWASKNSVRKIEFDDSKCIKCGKCNEVCTVDAVEYGKINEDECRMCLECVDNCPQSSFDVKDNWRRSCTK